jgi:hypothetical protein
VPRPSEPSPRLRTYVPVPTGPTTCAAPARCPSPHTLVPIARGRRPRRLGGRPERDCLEGPSAPGGAARAPDASPSGAGGQAKLRMPVPRQRPAASAPGPLRDARSQLRRRAGAAACALLALAVPQPSTDTASGGLRASEGPPEGGPCSQKTGGVLLSQALASQVPSALRGLTALFGMGRGVSPSPKPPEKHERPRLPGPSKLHSATAGTTKKIRQALDPLVPVSFRRHRPSRSGLSTWWSTRGLTPSRGWQSSS